MTGEGREYGRRKREGNDEDEEIDRMVREMRREIENEESHEPKEHREHEYDPEKCVREAIREIQQEEADRLKLDEQKESKEEPQETKEKVETPEEWDVDECVRTVIQEVQEEEAERQRLREEREHTEMEKEQQMEASYESRKESADKDELDEYEERIREAFEEHGIDPEEVKGRWRKKFEEEVQDELGEKSRKESEGEDDEAAGQEKSAESRYYYDDGSGQVYEVQMESKERPGSETESSGEVQEVPEKVPSENGYPENTEPKKGSGEIEPEEVNPSRETEEAVREQPRKGEQPEHEESTKIDTEEAQRVKERTTTESAETSVEESSTEVQEKASEKYSTQDEIETQRPDELAESEGSQGTEENLENESESREEEIWNEYERKHGSVEDEAHKRYLREVLDQLPEEEKAWFREFVRNQVQTIEDFEELVKRHGLEELLEDEEVMEEVRNYLELRKRLADEHDADIEGIAEELGIDLELAREWSRGESEPYSLKKLLNLEAFYLWDEVIRSYREQNQPRSREELEDIIESNTELRADRFYRLELDDAIAFVEIMAMRRRGEIERRIRNGREVYSRKQITELSKKYVISSREIISWLRGEHVPPLINKIRNLCQKNEGIKTDKHPQKRGQRGTYQINIAIPIINEVRISSYEQFLDVLKQEKPALLLRKDIKKLLRFCEVFLNLVKEFETKTEIHSYDISSISKRTGLSKTTIREWLTKGFVPRLFYLINKVPTSRYSQISLSSRVAELEKKTNGIVSEKIMLERLESLYIENEIKRTKKSLKDSSDFFSVISSVQNGAISIERVAKKCNLHEGKVKSILHGLYIPRFVNLLSSIPTESLPSGWKWLPLILTGTKMKQFIKVPVKINSLNDLQIVLSQMKARSTSRMSKLEKQFGDVSPIQSFLYYLGLTISDGNFDTSKKGVLASARMKLKLAKKYHWSINAGNAYCHALERMGFGTRKGKDELWIRDDGTSSLMHQWRSISSPFFIWVKKTLLGLNPNEPKNNNRIKIDWILDMPRVWRISLLQGITDGDASASFQGQFIQVHTYTNQEFYKRLLTSLGIKSFSSTNYVGISGKESIRLAEKLPMFKHASSRQENISKLLKMLSSHNWSRITTEEEEFILDLHNQGYRVGIIIEKLWNRFGRTRRRNTIYELIKRKGHKI